MKKINLHYSSVNGIYKLNKYIFLTDNNTKNGYNLRNNIFKFKTYFKEFIYKLPLFVLFVIFKTNCILFEINWISRKFFNK